MCRVGLYLFLFDLFVGVCCMLSCSEFSRILIFGGVLSVGWRGIGRVLGNLDHELIGVGRSYLVMRLMLWGVWHWNNDWVNALEFFFWCVCEIFVVGFT